MVKKEIGELTSR